MTIGAVQNQETGGSARGKINESIEKSNEVDNKMDKISTAQNGNVAIFNAAGQVIDSGEQLGGGTGSNIPEWNQNEIYPLDFVVQRSGKLFASKIEDNQGNEPPIEGENTFWRETSASESTSTPLWAAGVFNKERAEVYVLDGSIYKKYVLTVTALPFESTDFGAELLAGDWQLIGGGDTAIQSVIKDPFTETIEIANLLQHSPNYTQTGVLNIVKGATSAFINGTYEVAIHTNGDPINGLDVGNFETARNDYFDLGNPTGKFRFIFALMSDGLIGVSVYQAGTITFPTISNASVETSDPDALVVVFSEPVNITDLSGLSLNFISGTAKTIQSVGGTGTNTLTFAFSANIEEGDEFTLDVALNNNIESVATGNKLQPISQSVTNNVGFLLNMTDLVDVSVSNNRVTKIGTGTDWDAGAFGVDGLSGDFELIVAAVNIFGNKAISFGISNANADASYTSIDYALLITDTSNEVIVWESGTSKSQTSLNVNNTHYRIRVSSGTVTYSRSLDNKSTWDLLYTSLISPSGTYYIDCSIKTQSHYFDVENFENI